MCGRLFTSAGSARELLDSLGLSGMDFPTLNNQAPAEQIPVIFMENQRVVMKPMRWGLHPRFATEAPTSISLTHSARIETVETLPTYRDALQRQRGFVSVAGIVEWRTTGKVSEPFYIHCPEQPFAIAGIWDVWKNEIFSFSIITQRANAAFSKIHPRMPLSLTSNQLMRWIDSEENAQQMLQEFRGHSLPLRFQPVDFAVNNTRNKSPILYVENQPR